MTFPAAVLIADAVTAACGLLNAGYFAGYGWRHARSQGRRVAAAVLVLVSSAAVAEALFSQGLFWFGEELAGRSGLWALLRLPLLVATIALSALVVRRIVS